MRERRVGARNLRSVGDRDLQFFQNAHAPRYIIKRISANTVTRYLPANLLTVLRAPAGLARSQATAAPEQIDIADGNLTLHARLYRPDGPGPFPAVVALHDCGGVNHRPNTEAQLYSEWAKTLVAEGFVVLFPDSFGSRNLGSQCREHHRTVHAWRERVGDANAARLWLQKQSYVRGDRVSLLGWANGAVTA